MFLKGIIYKIWNFLYYWFDLTSIFTQYVESKKKTLFVHENFSHLGLSFLYIYKYIYMYIYKSQLLLAAREEWLVDPDDVLKTKTFGHSSFYYPPIFLCLISGKKFLYYIFDIHGEVNFFLYIHVYTYIYI